MTTENERLIVKAINGAEEVPESRRRRYRTKKAAAVCR